MSDKDEIKELFQKELGNYQAKVNPNLWNGIQAGLGSAGAATGAATSIGLTGKIIIGISIAAAVTVGTFLVVNKDEKGTIQDKIVTNLKSEDSVSKETSDQIELKEEIIKDSSIGETSSVEKEVLKDVINDKTIENKIETSNYEEVLKDSKNKNSNNLTSQENTVILQETESKGDIKNDSIVTKKSNKTEIVETSPTPKETFISELDNFNIQIVDQKNQYVAFKVEEIPNNAYIVWDFGDGKIDRTLSPEHFYTESGIYNVTCKVKTETEEVTKNLKVKINILGKIENLPNVFTPNGDGNNDEFFVNCKNLKSFQLTIIDNQQSIIFSTNDADFRWNGFDKSGQPAKEGTYYYIIVAKDESGNTINKYQQLRLQR